MADRWGGVNRVWDDVSDDVWNNGLGGIRPVEGFDQFHCGVRPGRLPSDSGALAHASLEFREGRYIDHIGQRLTAAAEADSFLPTAAACFR